MQGIPLVVTVATSLGFQPSKNHDHCYNVLVRPRSLKPFSNFEVNIISAQDLALVLRKCVPVMIEIYAVKWFRDVRVGSVRLLVGNLLPQSTWTQPQNSGMRFVALQVRRPSGRPQGILNIGMALLDGSMRNYPRKSGLSFPSSEFGEPPLITITTGSMWSESDVGPAPSTIAAGTTAHDLFSLPETGGDVIDEWDPEKNTRLRDLKSKLERWKTELPPVYDRGHHHLGSFKSKSTAGHRRRHTDNAGLLSCFGDVYGFECAISCGVKPKRGKMA
ncbi:hypothetical protein IFM89_022522 [Coptis chinensis]|uniref:Uncharacterized protein n=1 Tax=Coptis chinensis TaxID=261450 RepID=A0A835LW57_9MAGN|nr:hypothetical protein IFM89_022522 [Coptis chinensis]